jgi:hypothetical protein
LNATLMLSAALNLLCLRSTGDIFAITHGQAPWCITGFCRGIHKYLILFSRCLISTCKKATVFRDMFRSTDSSPSKRTCCAVHRLLHAGPENKEGSNKRSRHKHGHSVMQSLQEYAKSIQFRPFQAWRSQLHKLHLLSTRAHICVAYAGTWSADAETMKPGS